MLRPQHPRQEGKEGGGSKEGKEGKEGRVVDWRRRARLRFPGCGLEGCGGHRGGGRGLRGAEEGAKRAEEGGGRGQKRAADCDMTAGQERPPSLQCSKCSADVFVTNGVSLFACHGLPSNTCRVGYCLCADAGWGRGCSA